MVSISSALKKKKKKIPSFFCRFLSLEVQRNYFFLPDEGVWQDLAKGAI